MKTRIAAVALAAVVAALAGTGGCVVDNRASIAMQAICGPPADCTFQEKCDAQYIGYPTLDKAAAGTNQVVWLFVQVANQLPNNADVATGRVNTNDAHVDETNIEYEGALSGEALIGSNFHVPAEGTAVISVQLDLTNAVAGTAAAPSEVVAHVRLRGYYDDGSRFETGDFPIAVKVCATGCAPSATSAGCDPLLGTCPPNGGGKLPFTCGG